MGRRSAGGRSPVRLEYVVASPPACARSAPFQRRPPPEVAGGPGGTLPRRSREVPGDIVTLPPYAGCLPRPVWKIWMPSSTTKKPSLREIQKEMTLEIIRKAARKTFYAKTFEEVSIEEIASEAGVSRGTIYLHFTGKNEILFDLLMQDMATQMAIYDELAQTEAPDRPRVRAWLQHFRDSMEERHRSMHLFPVAFVHIPERQHVVVKHRETAIRHLGERHKAFSLEGLSGLDRERKRASIYMMLFKIEQVSYTFSILEGTPDITVGLDMLADELTEFLLSK